MTNLYPQVDIKDWVVRWDLDVSPEQCTDCKSTPKWVKAFYSKKQAGVESEECRCGNTTYQAVLLDKQMIRTLDQIVGVRR